MMADKPTYGELEKRVRELSSVSGLEGLLPEVFFRGH